MHKWLICCRWLQSKDMSHAKQWLKQWCPSRMTGINCIPANFVMSFMSGFPSGCTTHHVITELENGFAGIISLTWYSMCNLAMSNGGEISWPCIIGATAEDGIADIHSAHGTFMGKAVGISSCFYSCFIFIYHLLTFPCGTNKNSIKRLLHYFMSCHNTHSCIYYRQL